MRIDELDKANREGMIVREMDGRLAMSLSVAEAYKVVANSMTRLFPSDSGALYVPSGTGILLEAAVTWGSEASGLDHAFGRGECWGLRSNRVHVVEGPESEMQCVHETGEAGAGYLCAPLAAQGEFLGMLHVRFGRDAMNEPTCSAAAQRGLITSIAEQVSLVLANINLRSTLRELSIRDPLTGLFNRRYMEETLEQAISQATRRGSAMGLMMVDIDRFKEFNDRFGHDAGDSFLCAMARALSVGVRLDDVVCRFGGEEFVVVLPNTTMEMTCRRAEEISRAVGDIEVRHGDTLLPSTTVSIGIAAFPEHGGDWRVLLEAADLALYRAKEQGRNCVVTAAPLLEEAHGG
jgi:diguanylate cyclase (GGDEF)-like protein